MKWSRRNSGRIVDGAIVTDPKTKVAILGGSTLTRQYAPLDDAEWEVWSLNNLRPRDADGGIRADRWFELHPLKVQSSSDMAFLRECTVPVYMFDVYAGVPMSVRFPLDEILASFPLKRGQAGDFFACTFAYQILLAMHLGFTTIGLFGVDLDQGSARERAVERASVAWWLGVASGRGVSIGLPPGCRLLMHPYRYGYDYDEEKKWVEAWMEPIAIEAAPWE